LFALVLLAASAQAQTIIQVQNAGSTVGTYLKYFKLNWVSGMTCAANSSTGALDCTAAGASGTVTSFSAGTLSPLFTTSVATASTTPALSFTLSNFSANTVLAGPSGLGAAAAGPTARALVAQDMPGGYGQCATLDSAICTSAVDGSGTPSFIAQGSAGNKLTITGTSLVLFIQGVYQTGTGTYTDAITGLGSSTFNYVYVKQDVAAANLAAADFAATRHRFHDRCGCAGWGWREWRQC